jgi:hypothetical protein
MSLKETRVKKALKGGNICLGTMVATFRSPQIVRFLLEGAKTATRQLRQLISDKP